MSSIDHYDFIIIGGGPAGQGAAEVAAIYGRRTLVIERNDELFSNLRCLTLVVILRYSTLSIDHHKMLKR